MLKKLKSNCKDIKSYFSKSTIALFLIFAISLITIYTVSIRKVVNVAIGKKVIGVVTYKSTVRDILEQNKIVLGSKDKVKPSLDTKVKNGQEIYIKKAINLDVFVDGKNLKVKSAENSVGSMLKAEKISLSDIDKVKPAKNSNIKAAMKVVITRVSSKTSTEVLPIGYETVVQKDDSMGTDQQQVVQQGVNGSKEVTTNITYEDGKEVSRNITSQVVKSGPIQAIVKVGTLGVVNVDRGGRALYKTKVSAAATGYTNDATFGITASGASTKRDENGYSSVAVDPRVIPLGTKLYIPGYGYGIADDTGGAIKGDRVDLFFNSESECYSWGVRPVDVYILK